MRLFVPPFPQFRAIELLSVDLAPLQQGVLHLCYGHLALFVSALPTGGLELVPMSILAFSLLVSSKCLNQTRICFFTGQITPCLWERRITGRRKSKQVQRP